MLHSYSQIFNIGPDASFQLTPTGDINLASNVDDTNATLKQFSEFDTYEIFNGSLDPVRGWQSTTFNVVSPIDSIHYYKTASSTSFTTGIGLEFEIIDFDFVIDDSFTNYSITLVMD